MNGTDIDRRPHAEQSRTVGLDRRQAIGLSMAATLGGVGLSMLDPAAARATQDTLDVCVRDAPFSATGDGSTDDSAAIADADAAAAAAGARLRFPRGTYVCGPLSPTAPVWCGDGPFSTTIRAKDHINVNFITPTSRPGLQFLNLGFDGNKQNQSTGNAVKFIDCAHVLMFNCRVQNGAGHSVAIDGPSTSHVVIDHCYISGAKADGICQFSTATKVQVLDSVIYENGQNDLYLYGSDVAVMNNRCSGSRVTAIKLNPGTTARVIGNHCTGPVQGIHLSAGSASVTIVGNIVKQTGHNGVCVENTNGASNGVAISANIIEGCSYSGIYVLGSKRINITGNICRSNGINGIRLLNVSDGVITGNTCTDNGQALASCGGIEVVHGSNLLIATNRCTDSQASKTQGHGVRLTGPTTGVAVIGNSLDGNLISDALFSAGQTSFRSDENTFNYGVAPPSSGYWLVGTIVKNATPTPGGYIGWVCSTEGSPGTWKGFGAIEA